MVPVALFQSHAGISRKSSTYLQLCKKEFTAFSLITNWKPTSHEKSLAWFECMHVCACICVCVCVCVHVSPGSLFSSRIPSLVQTVVVAIDGQWWASHLIHIFFPPVSDIVWCPPGLQLQNELQLWAEILLKILQEESPLTSGYFMVLNYLVLQYWNCLYSALLTQASCSFRGH